MIPKTNVWMFTRVVSFLVTLGWIASNARAQDVLIDNFNDGNDDGWTHHVWTKYMYGTEYYGSVFDASAGYYRLATIRPVPVGQVEILSAEWDPSHDSAASYYSDGVFRARVRAANAATGMCLFMRAPDQFCFGNSYVFILLPWGQIRILRAECGGAGPFWQLNLPYQPGDWWFMEVSAIANELSFRAWPVNGERPLAPQLVATDPNTPVFTTGALGVAVVHHPSTPVAGPLDGDFDDLYFTPACPADVNLDHVVDLSDLAVLLSQFGTACDPRPCDYSNGDLNGDGYVDLSDLALLLARFGATCS